MSKAKQISGYCVQRQSEFRITYPRPIGFHETMPEASHNSEKRDRN